MGRTADQSAVNEADLIADVGSDGPDRFAARRWVLICLGALVLLGAVYSGAAWATSGSVATGTTVLGTDIGGLERDAAVSRLTGATRTSIPPLALVVDGTPETLDPAAAGLELDLEETVDALVGWSWSPVDLWAHFVGGQEVPPVATVDAAALDAAMVDLAVRIDTTALDAAVSFADGAPVVQEPAAGRSLLVADAAEEVERTWLDGPPQEQQEPIELPVEIIDPQVGAADLAAVMNGFAVPATSGPVVVAVAGRDVALDPLAVTATLSVVADPAAPEGSRLVGQLDGAALEALLLATDPGIEAAPQDARIELGPNGPQIIPSVTGTDVEPEALAAAVTAAFTAPDRRAVVDAVTAEPALTTEGAQALGVNEQVSTFSTPLTDNAARTENLRIAARTLNGTLVLPGETFSLNDTLGERTAAKGYNEAPVIVNGRLELGRGGGVSQVATTTFNAMFFAGLEDVEHQPHSFYISRYPEGREATVNFGTVDLRWRNDSPYAVLIQAGVGGGEITVSFWSTRVWDIEAIKGPRTDVTQPETIYDDSEGCVSQNAVPGFRTTVTRVFSQGGAEVRRETFRTTYNPEDRVICGPEPG